MCAAPTSMQVVAIRRPGGPGELRVESRPVPEPRGGEVLIRVAAAGVNRPDLLQREGRYPAPADADPLPGLEVAGEVAALGASAHRWQIGDRVMALVHGGGYAGYCRAHESHCLPVPEGLGMVAAAAIPETWFTVWYNVFMRAALAAGESLLVHGGSGGIGTTAIQLAKATGARVLTTAGSDAKCEFCVRLGADSAFNYRTDDWPQGVLDATGGHGVNVVLDMVAGPYVRKNLGILARDGRYAIIAFLLGSTAELDLSPILAKRLVVTGSTLRPQSVAEKAAIADGLAGAALPLLRAGRVAPVIHATFPLAEAAAAHRLMESGAHMGKIVLTVTPGSETS